MGFSFFSFFVKCVCALNLNIKLNGPKDRNVQQCLFGKKSHVCLENCFLAFKSRSVCRPQKVAPFIPAKAFFKKGTQLANFSEGVYWYVGTGREGAKRGEA